MRIVALAVACSVAVAIVGGFALHQYAEANTADTTPFSAICVEDRWRLDRIIKDQNEQLSRINVIIDRANAMAEREGRAAALEWRKRELSFRPRQVSDTVTNMVSLVRRMHARGCASDDELQSTNDLLKAFDQSGIGRL